MFNVTNRSRLPYGRDTTRVFTFFALTFALTWALWLAAAKLSGGTLSPVGGMTIAANAAFLLGVFGPALVALLMTATANGSGAVSALISGIGRWPSAVRWYLFAIGYFAAIKLVAAALHRVVAGSWPPFGETPWYLMMGAMLISTPVQAGEEIGWRAFALPRLAAGFGAGPASVLVGVVWALWHLPLFLIPGTDTFGQSFPAYLTVVTALSVAMAWLYWRTEGSLLMTMLMHAAINNTKDIVPTVPSTTADPFAFSASTQAWLTALVLWVCAVYFLLRMRGVWLIGAARSPCSDLEEEARFLLESLFSNPGDATIVARYVDAHRQLFAAQITSPLVTRIVSRRLDAEAVEYALRRRNAGQELTRKLQILSYLAETRAAYQDDFVNLKSRRARAILSLAASVVRSGWKRLKGEVLVRRHGLL